MATASVPSLGIGDHASCIAPSRAAASQVSTRRYIAASMSRGRSAAADGSSRTMLAVTTSPSLARDLTRSMLHFVAVADLAANVVTTSSMNARGGTPMPAAPAAPFFKPRSSTAAAAASWPAAFTVANAVPDVILLSIIAARLGAATAASNPSSDRPPLLARSLWQTAQ
jgi:hypothetical protein